jgi:hypothetical protein
MWAPLAVKHSVHPSKSAKRTLEGREAVSRTLWGRKDPVRVSTLIGSCPPYRSLNGPALPLDGPSTAPTASYSPLLIGISCPCCVIECLHSEGASPAREARRAPIADVGRLAGKTRQSFGGQAPACPNIKTPLGSSCLTRSQYFSDVPHCVSKSLNLSRHCYQLVSREIIPLSSLQQKCVSVA